jgi:DNA-binding NarL/FixJ family response regulator
VQDGATDRALLEDQGCDLYETVVAEGGIPGEDPRIAPGGTDREAFDLLVSLGLLHRDTDDDTRWMPVDPGTAQSRIVAPLSQEGTRLLEAAAEWARDFSALGHIWRRGPQATSGPFSYLRGSAIAPYIATLATEATEEILTAQPQTGRDLGVGLEEALDGEQALLDRGVRVLTLYQHAARRSTATQKYVAAVTELGAEVRTLDEFFHRLIVIDRRVAIIPTPDDLGVALAVREPTVVAYLVDVFMRSWERARPFTSTGQDVSRHIAGEQRAMTIRMLIEGHSDPVAAKRLGVSSRTYAAYVADLKEEFEADTRFQLGYLLGRQGLTGNTREGQ